MTWHKGRSGNPGGKPTPVDITKARRLNRTTTTALLNEFLFMKREELQVRMQNSETPLVELIVGKIIEQAIKHGDERRLNFLLDRLIGKVKEDVDQMAPKPTVMRLIGQDAVMVIGQLQEGEENETSKIQFHKPKGGESDS